jgi:hypothetical protein
MDPSHKCENNLCTVSLKIYHLQPVLTSKLQPGDKQNPQTHYTLQIDLTIIDLLAPPDDPPRTPREKLKSLDRPTLQQPHRIIREETVPTSHRGVLPQHPHRHCVDAIHTFTTAATPPLSIPARSIPRLACLPSRPQQTPSQYIHEHTTVTL